MFREPNYNLIFFIVLIFSILIWSNAIGDETPKFTKSNCVIEVIYD